MYGKWRYILRSTLKWLANLARVKDGYPFLALLWTRGKVALLWGGGVDISAPKLLLNAFIN